MIINIEIDKNALTYKIIHPDKVGHCGAITTLLEALGYRHETDSTDRQVCDTDD